MQKYLSQDWIKHAFNTHFMYHYLRVFLSGAELDPYCFRNKRLTANGMAKKMYLTCCSPEKRLMMLGPGICNYETVVY